MPRWSKGQSGNPTGVRKEKLFHHALKMQIAEAGDDLKRLRKIAEQLLKKAEKGDLVAIREVADRLDGKPTQESHVNLTDKREPEDWTRGELVAFLNHTADGSNGADPTNGRDDEPDSVH